MSSSPSSPSPSSSSSSSTTTTDLPKFNPADYGPKFLSRRQAKLISGLDPDANNFQARFQKSIDSFGTRNNQKSTRSKRNRSKSVAFPKRYTKSNKKWSFHEDDPNFNWETLEPKKSRKFRNPAAQLQKNALNCCNPTLIPLITLPKIYSNIIERIGGSSVLVCDAYNRIQNILLDAVTNTVLFNFSNSSFDPIGLDDPTISFNLNIPKPESSLSDDSNDQIHDHPKKLTHNKKNIRTFHIQGASKKQVTQWKDDPLPLIQAAIETVLVHIILETPGFLKNTVFQKTHKEKNGSNSNVDDTETDLLTYFVSSLNISLTQQSLPDSQDDSDDENEIEPVALEKYTFSTAKQIHSIINNYHKLMDSPEVMSFRHSYQNPRTWTPEEISAFEKAFKLYGYGPTANRKIANAIGAQIHPNHVAAMKRQYKRKQLESS